MLIFIGTSCSGKSTLANLLIKDYNLKAIDIISYVDEIIKKVGKSTLNSKELRVAYQKFLTDLPSKDFHLVEVASDWPDIYLPKIVNIIKDKVHESIKVIFCSCSLDTTLLRNKKRKRPVPEYTIKKQNRNGEKEFTLLCKKLEVQLIKIVTENCSSVSSYQYLQSKLKLP